MITASGRTPATPLPVAHVAGTERLRAAERVSYLWTLAFFVSPRTPTYY